MSSATTFIAGCSAVLALVAALFFLRFWLETRDRFFAIFALAFAIFGANRIALSAISQEHAATIYGLRLAAFALIIVAIVDKNRA